MINVSSWYKRKWKAYTPTDEESKWGIATWTGLVTLVVIVGIFFYLLIYN